MKKQNNKIDTLKQRLKKHKIVGSIVIATLLFVAAFSIFKFVTMQHDRKQFNEAEQKLRGLKLPKAESTTYNQSCSYRSSKDIVRTSPICSVLRTDKYSLTGSGIELTKNIYNSVLAQGGEKNNSLSAGIDGSKIITMSENDTVVKMPHLTRDTDCSAGFLELDENNKLVFTTICSKRAKFQVFPEIY